MSASFSSMISVNLMSILICGIVLYANIFEVRSNSQRSGIFNIACTINIIALLLDTLTYLYEGKIGYDWILYPATTLSNAIAYLLVGIFIMYVSCYVKEKKVVPPPFFKNFTIYCVVCFGLTIMAPIFGLMFHYENGVLVYTELYTLYVCVNIINLLVGIGVICYARPIIGLHNAVATGLYLAIPCDAAIANFIWPNVSYTYPCVTLSIVILYVMMQSESLSFLEKEKQISNYYAHHDELTGLLSRRAFNERMEELKSHKSNSAVIFMDMNGLKITNDKKGHIAGDNLLIKFAELIEDVFRKEDIFRIGGDEFVVIIEDIEESTFNERIEEFKEKLGPGKVPLACFGTKYGKSYDIEELIRVSESIMYKEKLDVHKKYPELNR